MTLLTVALLVVIVALVAVIGMLLGSGPRTRHGETLDLTPAAARGELDLDWSDPRPIVGDGEVEFHADPQAGSSVRGEVYELGPHRVMCGDATSEADVAALVAGERPRLCVTDPPYGVSYDPAWRTRAAEEGHDDRADWREAWELFPGDVIYSWHPAGATSLVHAAALQDSGFELRMQIIWAKSNFPIGRGDYHVRHEPCWYAVRKGAASKRTSDRKQTTLWEINLDRNVEGGHSTQKPVECMARPIRNHQPCDVYDPFCGSGTTVVAAEMLGRRCFAMEIDPAYCDVIRQRYADYAGRPDLAP